MALGWVSAGISAVGTIGGIIAGNKQQKSADRAQSNADALNRRAMDLQEKQLDQNAYIGRIAQDQYDDYRTTYRPLEHQLVADAQNYDTPAAYEQAAADAQGTVSSQLGLARERLARRPGYDPSSAAAQASGANLELQGAALGAQAQNAAREGVRDKAWARKIDALGLGKGLVSNATTGMAQAANGLGNAAGAAGQLALNSGRLADAAYQRAGQTASNVGGMITGLGNLGMDAYKAWQQGNRGASNYSAGNFDYQPTRLPIDTGALSDLTYMNTLR